MKLNIVYLLFFSLIILPNCYSAIPSVDGIFKNLNNKPVTEKLITLKAKAKTETVSETLDGQIKEYYIRIMLFQRNENQMDVLHTVHTSRDFNNKTIVDLTYLEDVLGAIVRGEENILLSFYALIGMLGSNNSKIITTFIKKRNSDYVIEKEVLNQEKIKLLEAYLTFLKSGEALDSGNSPLKPKSDAEKNKIDELMSTRFYKPQTILKMAKTGSEINWVLKLENVDAYFDGETFRLKKFKSNLYEQVIAYDFLNYILMDGIHEFPKTINILNEGKGQTRLTVLDVNYSDDKTNQFKKIASELLKLKLPSDSSVVTIPSFLLMN